jgi:8-oxo-dGTP pyrophosphatase MutT (NUDIX family)
LADNSHHSFLDYQILFLKRAENTYAGGFYAFPGGKVEAQDFKETWLEKMPEVFEDPHRFDLYHDFNKRMAAIRELFEECNLLLVKHGQISNNSRNIKNFPAL